MGRKRKAPRPQGPSGPKEVDAADASLTVRTYKDVANSEDEYWDEQDHINFDDDDPYSKRSKRQRTEDELLELSDEEILADDTSDDDDDEHDIVRAASRKGNDKGKNAGKRPGGNGSESEDAHDKDGGEGEGEEEEGDSGWWGSSKQGYYDADEIEDEDDALEEEAESKRMQAKKLAKMQEDDFFLDQAEWANGPAAGEEDEQAGAASEDGMVTEVLPDMEITDDMGPERRKKTLDSRYPEFDYLADELLSLQELLATVQEQARGMPVQSAEAVKLWVLGAYIASLASYFAILASPSRDGDAPKTIDPVEMKGHEIIGQLTRCRATWLRAKALKPSKAAATSEKDILLTAEDGMVQLGKKEAIQSTKEKREKEKKKKAQSSEVGAKQARSAKKAEQAEAIEQSLANLSSLMKKAKPKRTAAALDHPSSKGLINGATADDNDNDDVDDQRSDFGDEEVMGESTARDKAKRKKSLHFYTSQIAQKANKRADAASGYAGGLGGDTDIPYRERLRDRQARLNAEAERRGRKGAGKSGGKGDTGGDDLGADGNASSSGGEDNGGGGGVGGENVDDNEYYYNMVAHAARTKAADKKAFYETLATAGKGDRVVEEERVGEDGKRGLTWTIQKNKGLAPRRKKENRNPRVKKRMQFADKQKKLRSMRATYKGPQKGSYKGELSGISTHVVKSRKL